MLKWQKKKLRNHDHFIDLTSSLTNLTRSPSRKLLHFATATKSTYNISMKRLHLQLKNLNRSIFVILAQHGISRILLKNFLLGYKQRSTQATAKFGSTSNSRKFMVFCFKRMLFFTFYYLTSHFFLTLYRYMHVWDLLLITQEKRWFACKCRDLIC